jgi:hypothetical protein
MRNNNLGNNYNTWGNNYRTKKNSIKKNNNDYRSNNINYSKSSNTRSIIKSNRDSKKKNDSDINIEIINNESKLKEIINLLKVTNINDAIIKINELLQNENDMNKLKIAFNNKNEKNTFLDRDKWVSNIIKNYKRNEKYKTYCHNIMKIYKKNNFQEFKTFIDNILDKNNNKMKKIDTIEEENKSNNIRQDGIKKFGIVNRNNNKDIITINSEDINYINRNNNTFNNYKKITEYMKTHY